MDSDFPKNKKYFFKCRDYKLMISQRNILNMGLQEYLTLAVIYLSFQPRKQKT